MTYSYVYVRVGEVGNTKRKAIGKWWTYRVYRRWVLKGMWMCATEGTGWNRLKINSVSGFYEN
jgi:hypothetical protein